MSRSHNLLKIGGVTTVISLLALFYNFINLYSIADKCPDSIVARQCTAIDDWVMLNNAELMLLVIGIAMLIIGLLKRRHDKS